CPSPSSASIPDRDRQRGSHPPSNGSGEWPREGHAPDREQSHGWLYHIPPAPAAPSRRARISCRGDGRGSAALRTISTHHLYRRFRTAEAVQGSGDGKLVEITE